MYIYLHKNKINGKCYIGQTIQKPSRRWRKNGIGYKLCPKFYSAIQKYGWNNFEHEILCWCNDYEADFLEKEFIKKYNSIENGYNLDSGGHFEKHRSQETKNKLREAGLKQVVSDETKAKISEGLIGRVVKPETRQKISNSLMNHIVSKENKIKHIIAYCNKPNHHLSPKGRKIVFRFQGKEIKTFVDIESAKIFRDNYLRSFIYG